jgi:hypothetical protein
MKTSVIILSVGDIEILVLADVALRCVTDVKVWDLLVFEGVQ